MGAYRANDPSGQVRAIALFDGNRCGDPTYEFRARVEMMCAVPG